MSIATVLGVGLLGMGLAKHIGSPIWGWTIGYFTAVAVTAFGQKMWGKQ